jgi:hypothetical protein
MQALLRKTAITDEKAPGPSRLLVNLALKSDRLQKAAQALCLGGPVHGIPHVEDVDIELVAEK